MVETLIYFYLTVCVSMILFNLVCACIFRRQGQKLNRSSLLFEQQIEAQIRSGSITSRDEAAMIRKLKRVSNLMAFDETLRRLYQREPEKTQQYIISLSPVFTYLTFEYMGKDALLAAYFPYLIFQYGIFKGQDNRTVSKTLIKLLSADNLYCRENAMLALYTIGNADSVVEALQCIDRSEAFHHPKLISDGLLTFSGNREALDVILWGAFPIFTDGMKVAVLDYFRFCGDLHAPPILRVMSDPDTGAEVCYSCIRYFGKYPSKDALPYLYTFAAYGDARWEFVAITAMALAGYPCKQTADLLKQLLRSRSWYVRYNAAESLERLQVPYEKLMGEFFGRDRYAMEMLQYHHARKKLTQKEDLPQ